MNQGMTDQEKEAIDLGFNEARQRRGLYRWFLAISVSFNVILFYNNREQQKINNDLLKELVHMQLDTKKNVDTIINRK